MATRAVVPHPIAPALQARKIAAFPRMRVLAWDQDVLYASRGYTLLKARCLGEQFDWTPVASYKPGWLRKITSQSRLGCRLVRDGFHALAVHPSGNLIAAVPGAITTLRTGEPEFRVTHRLLRGTRPLHICTTPDGRAYWGEYFDNAQRDEVHIYASDDGDSPWHLAYTFPSASIRHVHNIVYDRWEKCLWFFTGDYGRECRILRASLDLSTVDEIVAGNQQARAVAVIVDESGLFFASDTPLEPNHVYHLDRRGRLQQCAEISSSSIYGCRTRSGMFFCTMIEPSEANPSRNVTLYGSADGARWDALAQWRKDRWPMKYFQYGNASLPDGENSTDLLAITTIAVEHADLETSIWKVC
jgi:hypothetical protein